MCFFSPPVWLSRHLAWDSRRYRRASSHHQRLRHCHHLRLHPPLCLRLQIWPVCGQGTPPRGWVSDKCVGFLSISGGAARVMFWWLFLSPSGVCEATWTAACPCLKWRRRTAARPDTAGTETTERRPGARCRTNSPCSFGTSWLPGWPSSSSLRSVGVSFLCVFSSKAGSYKLNPLYVLLKSAKWHFFCSFINSCTFINSCVLIVSWKPYKPNLGNSHALIESCYYSRLRNVHSKPTK